MARFKINKIVKTLIGADMVFLSALGLIAPIFAIFITDKIKGGSIEVVGFAAAIYWISRSIFEIPIAKFLDRTMGEKDDLYFLVVGYTIVAFVHFGYVFSSLPWHIYLLQGVYALGAAISWPAWSALFTRHIDKGREGFEWSVEHVSFSLGIGITGAIGGVMVAMMGFNIVFVLAGIFALLGGLLPLIIYKDIKKGDNWFLSFFKNK
ncbi:MAG: MFS transporter [bacterium]|nr:MFS transporter [bacterium]